MKIGLSEKHSTSWQAAGWGTKKAVQRRTDSSQGFNLTDTGTATQVTVKSFY